MRPATAHRRHAFTIIEMVGAVTLAALLAGAVLWSTGDTADRMARRTTQTGLAWLDRNARLLGERAVLIIDLSRNEARVELVGVGGEARPPEGEGSAWRVAWADGAGVLSVGTVEGTLDRGEVRLPFAGNGWSPTYVLRWANERNDGAAFEAVAGVTGQRTPGLTRDQAEEVLRALSRPDVD